jgi:hypothetical protein
MPDPLTYFPERRTCKGDKPRDRVQREGITDLPASTESDIEEARRQSGFSIDFGDQQSTLRSFSLTVWLGQDGVFDLLDLQDGQQRRGEFLQCGRRRGDSFYRAARFLARRSARRRSIPGTRESFQGQPHCCGTTSSRSAAHSRRSVLLVPAGLRTHVSADWSKRCNV